MAVPDCASARVEAVADGVPVALVDMRDVGAGVDNCTLEGVPVTDDEPVGVEVEVLELVPIAVAVLLAVVKRVAVTEGVNDDVRERTELPVVVGEATHGVSTRMAALPESPTQIAPLVSIARPLGERRRAAVAAPPSPL